MKASLRFVAGAAAVGAVAWMVAQHGWASANLAQRIPRGASQTAFEVIHVVVHSTKSYDRLRADFESIVHRADFDILGNVSAEDMERKLKAMPEKDGLMILAESEVGQRQTLLVGHPVRAKHYLVGNPLIASQMIGRHTDVSLYVPLRVLVYEDERGRAVIAYDQPSSILGQFRDEAVLNVARMLDQKLGEVATQAAG
jgi:uncharacterized protein (DUF302 family)